jgi:hypothetical protein
MELQGYSSTQSQRISYLFFVPKDNSVGLSLVKVTGRPSNQVA